MKATLKQNTMVTYPGMNALLAILTVIMPLCASSLDTSTTKNIFGISGEATAFLDNIEYSTRFQTGETMFGASARLRFFYAPAAKLRFSFGAFGLRRFGDDRFLTRKLPLFRAEYHSERLLFVIGELVSADAHGLPDMLYRQEYRFDPGVEEGVQVRVKTAHVTADLWASWDSLNTPLQREHFTAGSAFAVSIKKSISFPLFLTIDHTGGEQYDIPGRPVQERFCGAAGVSADVPLASALQRVFGQALIAASSFRVRSDTAATGSGYGVIGKAGISPFGFDCSLQWFKGKNLRTPMGNPIYRTNQPIYSFEISRSYNPNKQARIDGGLRIEKIETDYKGFLEKPQYRFWIVMQGGFEKKFK
jgi:hypothetical protein